MNTNTKKLPALADLAAMAKKSDTDDLDVNGEPVKLWLSLSQLLQPFDTKTRELRGSLNALAWRTERGKGALRRTDEEWEAASPVNAAANALYEALGVFREAIRGVPHDLYEKAGFHRINTERNKQDNEEQKKRFAEAKLKPKRVRRRGLK